MPVLPASADWGQYLADMADDVLAGRAGDVNVIQIAPVPDVVDEPAMHADVQAEIEAATPIEKAEAGQDADLEI